MKLTIMTNNYLSIKLSKLRDFQKKISLTIHIFNILSFANKYLELSIPLRKTIARWFLNINIYDPSHLSLHTSAVKVSSQWKPPI